MRGPFWTIFSIRRRRVRQTVRARKAASSFSTSPRCATHRVAPAEQCGANRIKHHDRGKELGHSFGRKFFVHMQYEAWRQNHSALRSNYRLHRTSSKSHKRNVVTYQYWCWICGAGITSYDCVGDSAHGGVFDWQRPAVTERCDSRRCASDGECVVFSEFSRRSPASRRIQWNIFEFRNVWSSRKSTARRRGEGVALRGCRRV